MVFEQLIGQSRIKKQIKLIIQQGKTGKMPHIGICGPSGMGKTMLTNILIDEICAKCIYINGTAIKNPITFLKEIYKAKASPGIHHIIFIDEAHNLPKRIQENMLSILEEPAFLCLTANKELLKHIPTENQFGIGQSIRIKLPSNVSFILATTHKGELKETILNRIEIVDLDDYSEGEAIDILRKNSKRGLTEQVLSKIVKISKHPREMKKNLRRFEAFIDIIGIRPNDIHDKHFSEFCAIQGVGEDGCDKTDLEYLTILFNNHSVGLNSLASMLHVPQKDITFIIEPWLLKKNLIKITPRGRELTSRGYDRIGKQTPENKTDLFEIAD